MVGLRLVGFIFGVSAVMWGFFSFRSNKIGRFNFLSSCILGFVLCLLAMVPDTANILRTLTSLDKFEYGRIAALLIISNLFLWFFIIILRGKIDRKENDLDLLTKAIGLDEFTKRYGEGKFESVCILIPAFNESKNLSILLNKIQEKVLGFTFSVLVIDDGSTDCTADIVLEKGCHLASNKINCGGGAALKLGYKIAEKRDSSILVTMDADNQHDPTQICDLIKPIVNGNADIVIGSRLKGSNNDFNFVRLTGLHFFNSMISLLTGIKITDCSSGFRAVNINHIKKLNLTERQYHTSEFIIEAAKNGLKISEVPISINQRLLGKSKKGNNWHYGFSFSKALLSAWWREKR